MENFKSLYVLFALFIGCQAFPTVKHNVEIGGHIHKEHFLRDFQAHLQYEDNGCECHGDSCYCCVHADVKQINLNHTVCVVLDYLPKELGVDVKLNLDDKTLFTEEVSLRNPPPVCAGIPHLEKYASICLVFYNITWDQKAGGCIKLDAKLAGLTLEEINIGCFFYPLHGNQEEVWQKHVLSELKKMSLLTEKVDESAEMNGMIAKQMILEEDV